MLETILYALVFIYGIIVGSFLNVCIYRIPLKESVVTTRSHCMRCGYKLKWYDLVPVFSYVFLRGRCRKCGDRISPQYPIIELLNGILWVLTFIYTGINITSLIYSLVISALIVLSVIDFRTFEIPVSINVYIGIMALVNIATDYEHILTYIIGMIIVSGVLYLMYFLSNGRAIGGGDVKLMAACGLLLGWKLIIVAFIFGCLYASVIHILRMVISKKDHMLAMGPYLSAGVITAMWFGSHIVNWYVTCLFPG
ncbi:MAG: prepilin peptidase [Lachnospiraceae bacterium]|uniref:prepilin peptidase n=1 Tax=Falcatimonas sp. MSJ-15 TaxID=2841515 RepID=UPI001C11C17B|nr:A24 family peptidase [Falcatimonas sp. MSJ-15]MBU5470345.1 prepilin peptidase [Falcatimonas sp. MSJ-15]MEE0958623.1 prepilin peptidase [Lachnospiraceae bacterium]